NKIIDTWKSILVQEENPWVLFEHGTCIIIIEEFKDIKKKAKEIMKEWGVVVPGTNLGDFSVEEWKEFNGWMVHYAFDRMASFVFQEELPELDQENTEFSSITIGMLGREKRSNDARTLSLIYIEEKK
ncbi:MAG: hypothetical protein ACTSQB_06495, partial [Candidatus Heimdallarchaeota archaeon]